MRQGPIRRSPLVPADRSATRHTRSSTTAPASRLRGNRAGRKLELWRRSRRRLWPVFGTGRVHGAHYNRDAALIEFLRAPGASSLNFSGYYAYATWYLTGELRAASYRTDYRRPGTFDQIKILRPLSADGTGAWELAARISELNLNSGGFLVRQPAGIPSNIQGGRQTDMTIGLNWYPDTGIRFMANWIRRSSWQHPTTSLSITGFTRDIFYMRPQVYW